MKKLPPISLIFILTILVISSCTAPLSKDSYIEKFEEFDQSVSSQYENYDSISWVKTDKKFEKFSNEWYDKYKEDMTLKEKIKVNSLKVKYTGYKASLKIQNVYGKYFKDEVEENAEKIKYYMDNKMDDDIETLLEAAKEVGDSAVEVIQKILDKSGYEVK